MAEARTEGVQTPTGVPPQRPAGPPPMDWGRGRYERTAALLLPTAQVLVDEARLRPGERVLDVGTGTGNAALIAARAGARVIGVDPAPRLLEVARAQAVSEGLEVEFLDGEAATLPVSDHSCEVVLSNFAVIFAPDPAAAAAELVRVLAPGGRILLTAWVPGGTMSRFVMTAQRLIGEALNTPPQPPPFTWHEQGPLTELFAVHDLRPTLTHHEIAFTAASAAEYLEADRQDHPMAIAGFEMLDGLGRAEAAREALLGILEEGNEDPNAFRITERYVVVSAQSGEMP